LLDALVEIGLSTDAVFKPFSISPDVWYGVTDDITAGLVHSAVGMTGVIGGVGTSLCLQSTENGCLSVYPNVGFVGRYKLKNGPLSYAAEGGLMVTYTGDPFTVGLRAGGIARWQKDKLAVEAEPSLYLGVTERDGNRDRLTLPATGLYAVAPLITLAGQVGIILPLEDTGDLYQISLSIGGHYRVNESITATLAFSLPKLLGGGSGNGIDGRTLTLGGTYAF
jgi:hypothetical protein